MVRRVLITALATGAISFAILGWTGYAFPVYREYRITPRFYCYIYFSGGLVRLYGIRASDDIILDPLDGGVRMIVRRVADGAICHGYRHNYPWAIAPYGWYWARWNPRGVTPTMSVHFIGLRSWIWPPLTLLLAYPAAAIVRDRIHHYVRRYRRKHGLCVRCGYNLTGLIEPRCPECGTRISN
ncbi:MAG: hypothetical protein WBE26_04085 [Phycisphaerae bacterium]